MILIPAIDLKDGQCVRLLQGDFTRVTVYGEDPAAMASYWCDQGATRIHVVDLDGSRAGAPRNLTAIQQIVRAATVPVEVGGGIRDMETIDLYLDMGVQWVILGTSALKDATLVGEACRRHPDRIILGVDAVGGLIAVEAWTEKTPETAVRLARRYEDLSLHAVVYTDIQRDGMEMGVNVEATKALAEAIRIPVIASGGVAGIADVEKLMDVESAGIMGVIIGKALYTGAISLPDALRMTQPDNPARRKGV